MEEKQYLNNFVIKEMTGEYGSFLKVWIPDVDKLYNELNELKEDKSVNLIISKRKEKSEKGVTHYTYKDTFKPDQQKSNDQSNNDQFEEDVPF